MLQSRHIVVVDLPDGSTETRYQGSNVIAAEKALAEAIAEGKGAAAVVFHHPIPSRIRYPLQEKQDAARRVKEAEEAANAEANRNTRVAQEKRDQAKKLNAEAKRLEAEAAKHLPAERPDTFVPDMPDTAIAKE